MTETASPDKIRRQIIAWCEYRGYDVPTVDRFRKPAPSHDPFGNAATWVMSIEGLDIPVGDEEFGELLFRHGYWWNCLSPSEVYIFADDCDDVPQF